MERGQNLDSIFRRLEDGPKHWFLAPALSRGAPSFKGTSIVAIRKIDLGVLLVVVVVVVIVVVVVVVVEVVVVVVEVVVVVV